MITVKKLLEKLKEYPPNSIVMTTWEGIYTDLYDYAIASSKNNIVIIYVDQETPDIEYVKNIKNIIVV